MTETLQSKIDAMDFECQYCNMPLSKTTLNQAIQELRDEIKAKTVTSGSYEGMCYNWAIEEILALIGDTKKE